MSLINLAAQNSYFFLALGLVVLVSICQQLMLLSSLIQTGILKLIFKLWYDIFECVRPWYITFICVRLWYIIFMCVHISICVCVFKYIYIYVHVYVHNICMFVYIC